MAKALKRSFRAEHRRRRLAEIKTAELKVCHSETRDVFERLRYLENKMALFLTHSLPAGGGNYLLALEQCALACQRHARRLPYLLYLRTDAFGRCTMCGGDIPLHLLGIKRAQTTCPKCTPKIPDKSEPIGATHL